MRTWVVKNVVGDWILISGDVEGHTEEGDWYFLIFSSIIYKLYEISLHLQNDERIKLVLNVTWRIS